MSRKKESQIMESTREMLAQVRGEAVTMRAHHFMHPKEVRKQLDMTQKEFAQTFGFSLDTIKNWESGRRVPEYSAQLLLKVIAKNPKVVMAAV